MRFAENRPAGLSPAGRGHEPVLRLPGRVVGKAPSLVIESEEDVGIEHPGPGGVSVVLVLTVVLTFRGTRGKAQHQHGDEAEHAAHR